MRRKILICLFALAISCKGQEIEKTYSELLTEILSKRDLFNLKYVEANQESKDAIILEARAYLVNTIATELFPYWYGTQWDFDGTTRTPRKGKIACGYFVTNVLTDLGFDIPRVKWAQSASEVFIKKLSFKNIKRFSNKPVEDVKSYLINAGDGLYLVGLDSHTGFIYVHNKIVQFIHADYYDPEIGVVSEELDSYGPFADSSYRVIGKLMSDEMIVSWIRKSPIR